MHRASPFLRKKFYMKVIEVVEDLFNLSITTEKCAKTKMQRKNLGFTPRFF